MDKTHPRNDCEHTQCIWSQLPTDIKIQDFDRDDPTGCLKDPRQQSTKVEKVKNMNHDVSKTSKIIKNGLLSMILDVFEHENKNHKK